MRRIARRLLRLGLGGALGCLLATGIGLGAAEAGWQVLPGNEIRDLSESPDGHLWIATSAGALRFDGKTWRTVVPPVGPDLRRVLVDSTGSIWALSYHRGVSRFDGSSWGLPGGTVTLPDSQGRAILEDHRGDVWIGFVRGLARYERSQDRWTWLDGTNSGLAHDNVEAILEDRDGSLWFAFGRAGGVSVLDSDRTTWRQEQVRPGGLARDSVTSLSLQDDGSVWCGTPFNGGASRRRPDGTWRHYSVSSVLPSDSVATIVSDRRGGVWFGSESGGIGHFDGKSLRGELARPGSQPVGRTVAMLSDRSGVLWVATAAGELLRFDGVEWHIVVNAPVCFSTTPPARTRTVLARNSVLDEFEDSSGNLWLAPEWSTVAVLDTTGRWSSFDRAPDSVVVIAEDDDGLIHFGSRRAGVTTFDRVRNTIVQATQSEGLASDAITVLLVDALGEVWAGGLSGLSRRRAGIWSAIPGLQGHTILQLVEDGGGALWAWTASGIARLAPDRTTVTWLDLGGRTLHDDAKHPLCRRTDGSVWVGLSEGLFRIVADTLDAVVGPGNPGLAVHLQSLTEDAAGGLWTTNSVGVARLFDGSWITYLAGDGQPVGSNPRGPVHVDRRGVVWVPTGSGVSRFDGNAWQLLTAAHGLAGPQVDEILEDHRGHLWFRGPCGATEHAPDRSPPQTILGLAPDSISSRRDPSFTFGYFGDEEGVEFEHRLDGGPWSGFDPGTTFSVADLGDSIHRFEVRARDASGNVDPSPAALTWWIDATPPPARIESPPNQGVVRGDATIVGTTADARLRRWRLDVKPADAAWSAAAALAPWTTDGRDEASLAAWDTRTVPDGSYDLRLTVQDELGLEAIGDVRVLVDNEAPFAEVTSPRVVTREEGGEVFTAEGDARLFLPPGALDRDAWVELTGRSALLPDMLPLPSQAGVARRWFEVNWAESRLVRAATLEVLRAGPAAEPGTTLALYRCVAGESGPAWTRLGGTPVDSSGLRLALEAPGRYAVLVEGASAPVGPSALSGLRFAPRVLGTGGGGAGSIAIAFSLGQSSAVDVRVYNRAGRLVREVARGVSFPTGANLVSWDGLDRDGQPVLNGLYVVTVEAVGVRLSDTIAVVR